MTTNTLFNFHYEVLLTNGEKVNIGDRIEMGVYDAREYLLQHGVKISEATIRRQTTERIFAINASPYDSLFAEFKNRIQAKINALKNNPGVHYEVADIRLSFKREK